ncbi:DUF1804 family protein [Candidatus Magnetaquicoccus inordinatus]|uniref:DUF1804 family protein n=1 Tax=Candidatus Magnetaquicoccus inordinatus TaxID=2496818 RepID=UPI00102C3A99|nr:DUF1804 family protein [Candidatus Magnetaquicoccus inordinatus]
MAKTSHLPEARTRYVLQGMSPEEIAAELPVSAATVRRWLAQAKANGDDWDKARSAALLSTGGVDAINHAMLQLLSSTILRAQALLTTAMESDNPAETIKLIEVIRGLSDAHIKTINTTQRGSPEINRVAMIQDFSLALDSFILREFPDDIRVFRRIIPDFGRELMRVYGTATVSGQKVKELLARATLDLGMAQEVLERMIAFTRQHYPQHLPVIVEILQPFGEELSQKHGP